MTGALRGLLVAAALLLGGAAGCGSKQMPPVTQEDTLPVVSVTDVEAGIFDVVLKPKVAGGDPLRGLQVELGYDASALTITKVEGGPAAGRMDTVFDDGARQPGTLLAGITDLRQVALPLSGSALRVHYTAVKPGPVQVQVNKATAARNGGKAFPLPTEPATIQVR
jgi:hypothetical protein